MKTDRKILNSWFSIGSNLCYYEVSGLSEMDSSDPFENQLRDALTIGVTIIPLNKRVNAYCLGVKS